MVDNIRSGWAVLLAVPACTLMTGIVAVFTNYMMNSYDPLISILVFSLLEIGFLMYIIGLYRSLREITALAKKTTQWELLESELSSYEEYLESARNMRHDLRHHNALLHDFLQNNDIEAAKEYLHEYDYSIAITAPSRYCVNSVANAVLRIYGRRCEKAGILYQIQANIPTKLPLSASELGVVLSNILENALYAAQEVMNGSISLRCRTEEDTLLLVMENSTGEEAVFSDGFPLSKRPGGGIGMKNVAAVLTRYGGLMQCRQNGNIFITQLILPL
ncbi:MAG: GHKL domain-containing protein [Christensenella sp.]|nr:GHKL domain-containing protein [Christensenella sp.]